MTAVGADAKTSKGGRGLPGLASLQRIGRSLMLPLSDGRPAPFAASLARLGCHSARS